MSRSIEQIGRKIHVVNFPEAWMSCWKMGRRCYNLLACMGLLYIPLGKYEHCGFQDVEMFLGSLEELQQKPSSASGYSVQTCVRASPRDTTPHIHLCFLRTPRHAGLGNRSWLLSLDVWWRPSSAAASLHGVLAALLPRRQSAKTAQRTVGNM